ncbi:MAG: hypothetical protein ACR2O3_17330, partial [Rhizobiaceae bacterium]
KHPENVLPGTLALEALGRIRAIFPGELERQRDVLSFARDILEISPTPSSISDDMRLLSLISGGSKVSADIQAMIKGLDDLTESQSAALDKLQADYFEELSDFFSRVGQQAIADRFAKSAKLPGKFAMDEGDEVAAETLHENDKISSEWEEADAAPLFWKTNIPEPGITAVHGIGKSTAHNLEEMGICSLSDLANSSDAMIERIDDEIRMLPGNSGSKWRQRAREILAKE